MEKSREIVALEAELAALIRKMFQRNLDPEDAVASIIRGITYEERLAVPPACDLH